MAACGSNDAIMSDNCVQVVRNLKTVSVPCTRNNCTQYTVEVPRQISEQVPRTVHYTDYESRSKQLPYTVNRQERRTRVEKQKYQVPVTKTQTRMVPVTKKVCNYVTTYEPQEYNTTTMETRERQWAVPYDVNIPETKYRTVTEQVPIQKSKVEMDFVTKTQYDTQVRTRCFPETRIVTKQIPVYNVFAKPAPSCLPDENTEEPSLVHHGVVNDFIRIDKDGDGQLNYNEVAFDAADMNKDEQLSFDEYYHARATGNLANTANVQNC